MTARPRIAASIRLVLAMIRLYAGIEAQFGKALLDILRKQYPDQEITESDSAVGNKLMMIARKQLQGNDTDSMDAIQKFLMYLTTGSTSAEIDYDDDGKPIGKVWDFKKDWPTWQEALRAAYSNLRTTSMSNSMVKSRKKKNERSIDDAFGVRGEGGGDKSEGEARMPTPDTNALGKALDDQASVKEFYDLFDEYMPDFEATLDPAELVLFKLIMEDEVGGFSSDVKDNMGQATALKEKMQEELPDFVTKNEKRWSGTVGDLRKKLVSKLEDFVENHMSGKAVDTLYDFFHADVDPSYVKKLEKEKSKGKDDYQKGIDERKVARLKAEADEKGSSFDKQDELDRLTKKLEGMGVDVEAIKPDADAGAAGKKNKKKSPAAAASSMADRVASGRVLSWATDGV